MSHISFRTVRTSVLWGCVLIALDVADGTFVQSIVACPLWFVVSVVRSAWVRPGRQVALVRAAIPLAVLSTVLTNDSLQRTIAKGRAEQVVKAIGAFRDETGRYPEDLQELVPGHLGNVSTPKWAILFNRFHYSEGGGESGPSLWWIDIPPHGKRLFNFEEARWRSID